jgi:hypothetical protein
MVPGPLQQQRVGQCPGPFSWLKGHAELTESGERVGDAFVVRRELVGLSVDADRGYHLLSERMHPRQQVEALARLGVGQGS